MSDALREELEVVKAKKLKWQKRAVTERERAERAAGARRFTLYRALIGNGVGEWNVTEAEPPSEILGYPVETITVVESS